MGGGFGGGGPTPPGGAPPDKGSKWGGFGLDMVETAVTAAAMAGWYALDKYEERKTKDAIDPALKEQDKWNRMHASGPALFAAVRANKDEAEKQKIVEMAKEHAQVILRHGAYELAPPQPIHVHTHVMLDGKQVAENTTEHQARSMSNRTARGAAKRFGD